MSAGSRYLVDAYWLRHNTRRCRSCRAAIYFQQNSSTGKYLVLDVATREPHPTESGTVLMQSHFAVCPKYARKSVATQEAQS